MSQKRERFLSLIRSVNDLAGPVAEAVRRHQPVDSIRQIIRIPPGEYPIYRSIWRYSLPFGWRKTPERVLVFGREAFSVFDIDRGAVSTALSIPLTRLIDVHPFVLLLYSWLEMVWDDSGTVRRVKIEYNSVGDHHIWQGITTLRETFPRRAMPVPDPAPEQGVAQFPFKFRTYVFDSLMPGETLIAALYQPSITSKGSFFKPFISPNRVLALSDRNIFTIEDQRDRLRKGYVTEADYTVSRHFFPLNHLRSAQTESGAEADFLKLSFGVAGDSHEVVIPLLPPHAQQFHKVLHQHVLSSAAGV